MLDLVVEVLPYLVSFTAQRTTHHFCGRDGSCWRASLAGTQPSRARSCTPVTAHVQHMMTYAHTRGSSHIDASSQKRYVKHGHHHAYAHAHDHGVLSCMVAEHNLVDERSKAKWVERVVRASPRSEKRLVCFLVGQYGCGSHRQTACSGVTGSGWHRICKPGEGNEGFAPGRTQRESGLTSWATGLLSPRRTPRALRSDPNSGTHGT